jgi:hypothetical protein
MHRLAMFIKAGAPGVFPQATPVVLLLEADDLGDLGPLLLRRLEGAKGREARRACADYCNSRHVSSLVLVFLADHHSG